MAAGTCFDAVPEYAAVLLPTVLLIGVGFALGFPTLNMQATWATSPGPADPGAG